MLIPLLPIFKTHEEKIYFLDFIEGIIYQQLFCSPFQHKWFALVSLTVLNSSRNEDLGDKAQETHKRQKMDQQVLPGSFQE